MKRFVSVLLLIVFTPGCAILPQLTPREKTVTQAALEGGVLGAAIGSFLGDWLKDDPISGAFIGGWLGIVTGGLYGNHVADQREAFAREEAYLDACVRQAQKVNRQTQWYNQYLQQEIFSIKQEIARLEGRYQHKQIDKDVIQGKQKVVEQTLNEASEQLTRATAELLIQQEVRRREQRQSEERLAQLDTEIQRLQEIIEELSVNVEALAKINQRMIV